MFIIGQRSTENIIDVTGKYISSPPPSSDILNKVSISTGIDLSDLSCYRVASGEDIERLLKGDEYTAIWEDTPWVNTDEEGQVIDSGTNRNITSIDFSVEDNKRIVIFTTDDPSNPGTQKPEIIGDGVDSANIKVMVYLPDMSGIDTSYNEELKVSFIDPDGRSALSKVSIINGMGVKNFKTDKYGRWVLPSKYSFPGKNAKVYENQVYDIDVLMDM